MKGQENQLELMSWRVILVQHKKELTGLKDRQDFKSTKNN
jgi:hypothetical protein